MVLVLGSFYEAIVLAWEEKELIKREQELKQKQKQSRWSKKRSFNYSRLMRPIKSEEKKFWLENNKKMEQKLRILYL